MCTLTCTTYCLMITVAHTCSALLIAIDNINTVCEIGLLDLSVIQGVPKKERHFKYICKVANN